MQKRINTITFPVDFSQLEEITTWIREQFPYIEVEIEGYGKPKVDGMPSDFCGDTRLDDLLNAFYGINLPEMIEYHIYPHAEIDVTYYKGMWKAIAGNHYAWGFGFTSTDATTMLMHCLQGRRIWYFDRRTPDFPGLFVNSALRRKLSEQGVYTTRNLRALTEPQAYLLDRKLNAETRIIELWQAAQALESKDV